MKVLKIILITLIALLLTGCYTQLQYSQTMKKITDKNKKETKGYASSNKERAADENSRVEQEAAKTEGYADDYATEGENYIPMYYKDYEYAQTYDDCRCSPYNVYNFYGSPYDWYGYDYYRPYYSFRSHLTLSPFYFHKWHYRPYFGHRFPYSRFAFSISWGSPFHSFYYDPFYDPYFAYGFHHPISYNYFYFSGSFSGGKNGQVVDRNTRYGPRSIGTDRVVNGADRSRSTRVSGRNAAVTGSKSTVRTRSVGTTRTRSTDRTSGSTVNRTRSRDQGSGGSSNGTTRTRSRDNIQSESNRDRVYIDRRGDSKPVVIDRERARVIRSRTVDVNGNSLRTRSLSDNPDTRDRLRRATIDVSQKRIERERPTFFHRMKNFFKSSTRAMINRSRDWDRSRSSINSRRSSSDRSSVSRSNSSSSRSSVTRSRSSSSNSRSSGGSSRSRSGGDSSGGSDRSRDS